MIKYYKYCNATRRLKSNGYTFAFEVIEQVASSWLGILRLEDEGAQAALAVFADRYGIIEIDEAEYQTLLKKKTNSSISSPGIIQRITLPLKETVAGVVVLRSPLGPITLEPVKNEVGKKLEAADAVVLGTAPFVDPLATRTKSRSKKQSQ